MKKYALNGGLEGNSMTFKRLSWQTVLLCTLLAAGCGPNKAELKNKEVAYRELGKQYYLAGDYTTALKYLLDAQEQFADDHILQNYLGQVYLAKDKPQVAVEHFEKAVTIKPDYAVARNNMGVAYLAMEDWDKAIEVFNDVTGDLLYATPNFPLTNLGYAYYMKKEYALAEKYYLQALDIEPQYPIALRGLGRTYLAMGRIPEALAFLTDAVEKSPEFAAAYYDLGDAYLSIKDYRKAKAAYQRVVQLDPNSKWAKDAKKMLTRLRFVK